MAIALGNFQLLCGFREGKEIAKNIQGYILPDCLNNTFLVCYILLQLFSLSQITHKNQKTITHSYPQIVSFSPLRIQRKKASYAEFTVVIFLLQEVML